MPTKKLKTVFWYSYVNSYKRTWLTVFFQSTNTKSSSELVTQSREGEARVGLLQLIQKKPLHFMANTGGQVCTLQQTKCVCVCVVFS